MSILWAVIVGFIVGALARFIMPGKDSAGFLVTALLGIAGALVASFLGRSMGWYRDGESAGFVAALVGAVLLLAVFRMVKRPRALHS